MSIRAQMATSTAGIKGVSGEHPHGGGTPGPKAGYDIDNQKASKLTMVGSQSIPRQDGSGKHVSAPMGDQSVKVDQTWKGAPVSQMHVKAGPPPSGANTRIP